MRRISHYYNRLREFRTKLADRLNTWQDEAGEWVAQHILWPLGLISFGLTLLSIALLFLTFVGGGIGVILVAILDPAQRYAAGELYLGAVVIEFCLMVVSFVTAMWVSFYFDSRNGMY